MCDKIRQLQAETRKEERARAAQREKMLKKEIVVAKMEVEKKKLEVELAKKEAEAAAIKAQQETTANHLKAMIENHIPVEIISSILHISVDAVRKQASLLGCVL